MNANTRTLMLALLTLALAGCGNNDPADVTPTPTPVTTAPDTDTPAYTPTPGAVAPTEANIAAAREQIRKAAADARGTWANKTFEEFEAGTYKEKFEGGKYIVNGDIAIADRKLLREFFDKMREQDDGAAHGKLTVNTKNGNIDVWNSGIKKNLTYCVSDGFGTSKAAVVADMLAAARAWQDAADVAFVHVAAQDADCTAANENVLFDVRPVDVDGDYLARAFFPSDQRADRNVLIDATAFDLAPGQPLQLVGILRHELGHVLGWRHEHTRPEAGTCAEDENYKPLTVYDAFSTMHYPQCNGRNDWSLQLTGLDKAGAACIYGKGSNNNEDLEQCVFRVPAMPVPGVKQTETFDNQSVAKEAKHRYGPFTVKAGSLAQVKMTASGSAPGDPDLYVRYTDPVDTTRWNCRPYLSHANETCELEVPTNRSKLFVMVRGYAAGNYKLEVSYTKPD